jgi:endoglycosylceramidase
MKARFHKIFPALLLAGLLPLACSPGTQEGSDGRTDVDGGVLPDGGLDGGTVWKLYSTDGKFLRDGSGRAVILRGINIPNDYDQRGPEKEVRPPPVVFLHIADSGFNAVRLVIEWYQIEKERGVYSTEYLDMIERHVGWARDAGLLVFLDMHQDLFGRGFSGDGAPPWACDKKWYEAYNPIEPWVLNYFSAEVKACFDNFWRSADLRLSHQSAARAAAERVAGYENVMGFDTFNEPSIGNTDFDTFERDFLMPFHAEFAERVGKVLEERVFFIEPSLTFIVTEDSALPGPVTAFEGVFAPHYYNGSVETQIAWDGNESYVTTAVEKAARVAKRLKLPWIYGEMGGVKQTKYFSEYLFFLYGELDARMAGSFLWLYEKGETGFGLIDKATNDWTPHARAFLRPAPSKVAGTPVSFNWNYENLTFNFSWDEDPSAGDTEIILPAWVAKAGFEIAVDGNKAAEPVYNDRKNRLIVKSGPGGTRTFELKAAGPYPE